MKKKLLFIIGTFSNGGGTEKALENLINHLDRDKYEINILEIINYGKKSYLKKDIYIESIIYADKNNDIKNKIKYKIYFILIILFPALFRKRLKTYDYEICCNTLLPLFLIKRLNRGILWLHEDLDYLSDNKSKRNHLKYLILKRFLKKIYKIIVISKKSQTTMQFLFPEQIEKIHLIYNGYDSEKIYKLSNVVISDFKDICTKNNLISVGRLDSNKNIIFMLEVVRYLISNNYLINYFIIGEGNQNILEQKVKELEISDYVHFFGFQENPYPYIKISSVVCLSSFIDTFPTVLVEAMILEKTFITTPIAGAIELSDSGKTGVICEMNVESYAKNIINLLDNKDLYKHLSKNGKKYVKKFTLEKQIEEFNIIFK